MTTTTATPDDDPNDAEAIELLAALERKRIENPLYFYNHPTLSQKHQHRRQLLFHGLATDVKAFFGGNQSGKTTAGLADDLIQAVDEELLPDHLKIYKKYKPPFNCRIFAPSVQVLELVIFEKLKELIPLEALIERSWSKSYDKNLRVLRFSNGSGFQFMTYEQDVAKMGGTTIDRIHYDEEPPLELRIENRMRTVRKGGDEIFTLTPLSGLSWAYDQLWEPVATEEQYEKDNNFYVKDDDPDETLGVVIVDMDDNPFLTERDKKRVLKGLSKEQIQARKQGMFVHFSGLIYEDFKPSEHVIDPFDIPHEWNVVVSIDPGMRNRCAVIYGAISPNNEIYVFDEIYEQGRTIKEIAELIHRRNMEHQVLPIYYVIDPAARNKLSQTGRSDQMEFSDHGINTIPGQNAVEAGINRVRENLQTQKLFLFSHCTNLRKEFLRYRWREAPRTGEDGKPLPVKKDDHALDALRYLVMSRPYAPEVPEERNETALQRAVRLDQERGANNPTTDPHTGGLLFN